MYFIGLALASQAQPATGKALSGLDSVAGFCQEAGPLDTIEDLASDALRELNPQWSGTDVSNSIYVFPYSIWLV